MSQPLFFACRIFSAIVSLSLLLSSATRAEDSSTSAAALKKMSLEELLNQEVTSVSRTAQRAAEVATAVDVITGEDIRRSGANNIPDALRLVRALHVAQFDSHTWGISSRGFNLTTANKMQVLMDGRNLYSPLFSGVFWDVQNYPLDDLDRIEVIRGPGATMWGANAFNGVINIISKSARDTQGALIVGGGGNEEAGFGAVRYGGQLATNSFYRVYIDYFNRDDLAYANGEDARDNFMLGQTGFRSDTQLNDVNALTVQGDYYNGIYGQTAPPMAGSAVEIFSAVGLAPFLQKVNCCCKLISTRLTAASSTSWKTSILLISTLNTAFPIGRRHSFIYGLEYRLAHDNIQNPTATQFAFIPEERNMQLFSAFLQDEISLIEEHLSATLGSKFEHNDFSGFEIQPSVRLAYNPATNQTIWAGISRAVRTPTRIEVDWEVPPLISNQSRDLYKSESVIAYEAGYRIQLFRKLSYDITLFYNQYDRLRSLENIPAGPYFRNEFEGDGYGFSISQTYQPLEWWRLRLNYAYLETRLKESDNHLPLPFPGFGVETEGNDPRNLFTAHSSFNLPFNIEFDQVLRFVDELPNPVVPAYFELDLRLAWHPQQNLELALIGRTSR